MAVSSEVRLPNSGEQLPWPEGERKRGKETETVLTSRRSSGGARTSRKGGDVVNRRRRWRSVHGGGAARTRERARARSGEGESTRARLALYRPREGEERSAGRERGGEARRPAIKGLGGGSRVKRGRRGEGEGVVAALKARRSGAGGEGGVRPWGLGGRRRLHCVEARRSEVGDGADGRGPAGSDKEGEEAVWAGWAGFAAQKRKKGGREEWAGLEGEEEKDMFFLQKQRSF